MNDRLTPVAGFYGIDPAATERTDIIDQTRVILFKECASCKTAAFTFRPVFKEPLSDLLFFSLAKSADHLLYYNPFKCYDIYVADMNTTIRTADLTSSGFLEFRHIFFKCGIYFCKRLSLFGNVHDIGCGHD